MHSPRADEHWNVGCFQRLYTHFATAAQLALADLCLVLAGHIYFDQRFKGEGELFLSSLTTNTRVAEV